MPRLQLRIPSHWPGRWPSIGFKTLPVSVRERLAMISLLVAISWLTLSRLLSEHIIERVYLYGRETLRAVQAWENHGFLSMAGFFPLGGTYFPINHFPDTLYQSYPPLYLLPYWLGYRLVGGEAGFPAVKITIAFLFLISLGLVLGAIASLCFADRARGTRQLVFVVAYAITITNEAALRFCIIDEPDYLGLLFLLIGVALLGRWWSRPQHKVKRPLAATIAFFFSSWVYPIRGALTFLSSLALARLRLDPALRQGLRAITLSSLVAMALYWTQRLAANLMFPKGLMGSNLADRMGLTSSIEAHHGVLDSIQFLVFQQSGTTLLGSGVALTQRLEHATIWILGVVLFAIAFFRSHGRRRQLLLILSAAQLWLFIPLLHQSLSQHSWIYGIHFLPTVVLGWVGGLTTLLPQRHGTLVTPWMLAFSGLLIWAIQLRFFMVAYLAH